MMDVRLQASDIATQEATPGAPVRRGHSQERLRADLDRLGLIEGAVVLVHASMRRVAPLGADPSIVAASLIDALGPTGTLVVPTQTAWNSTTSRAFREATAGMTPGQVAAYKDSLPPFDPQRTPSFGMGALAEEVRTLPQAVRSSHPQTSFAAVGAHAQELMSVHLLDCHLGEKSPLGALYANNALVLMLGTGYDTSTAFHLAEYRLVPRRVRPYECLIADEAASASGHAWTGFTDIELDDSDFGKLGRQFARKTKIVRKARVGSAVARLYPLRSAVDFAEQWMRKHRR